MQNYIQYIHYCPGDPVKLKIKIILRNEKDKKVKQLKKKKEARVSKTLET